MTTPHYRPNERATIGPYPSKASLAYKSCTIVRAIEPIAVAHRYLIIVDGQQEVVVEQTLRKVFERGDWCGCDWQPKVKQQ